MKDYKISRRLSTLMMCFGAMCVLEMRGGKKLETICAEFNRETKGVLQALY